MFNLGPIITICLIAVLLMSINGMYKPPKEDFKKYKIYQAIFNRGRYCVSDNFANFSKYDVVYWNGYFRLDGSDIEYYCYINKICKGWISVKYLNHEV